ncbi:MAG: ATP-binding protein [Bacteroidia bacterium]|nr:ATP-binding protein [Bacteroidia bacterium]
MSKIRIRNFGPVKRGFIGKTDWMEVGKVTVFIGNQGSGKSTVAKLISTFSWIEKALTRGDYDISWFTQPGRFQNKLCAYHRLENYFTDLEGSNRAELEFQGDSYSMLYKNGVFSIEERKNGAYPLPQIMYVPAERNFISTVRNPKLLKLSSDSLMEFLTEFENAKSLIKDALKLPINDAHLEYDPINDITQIRGTDYQVRLEEASSGFQSLAPLFLVSWYLANSVKIQAEDSKEPMSPDELARFRKGVSEIWSNESLTDEQKRAALSVLSSRFNKTAFVNIVEEPEQNLFPNSQRHLLNGLLAFNSMNQGNKLILTTHSPYIINYLSLAIQGDELKHLIRQSGQTDKLDQLNSIVPLDSTVQSSDVVIYQLDERDGSIRKLEDFEGIPSDRNYLNQQLGEGNQLFDSLLELEQAL